jgi:hypothetical protein
MKVPAGLELRIPCGETANANKKARRAIIGQAFKTSIQIPKNHRLSFSQVIVYHFPLEILGIHAFLRNLLFFLNQ